MNMPIGPFASILATEIPHVYMWVLHSVLNNAFSEISKLTTACLKLHLICILCNIQQSYSRVNCPGHRGPICHGTFRSSQLYSFNTHQMQDSPRIIVDLALMLWKMALIQSISGIHPPIQDSKLLNKIISRIKIPVGYTP